MSLNKLPEVIEKQIIDDSFFEYRKEKLHIEGEPDYDYYTLVVPSQSVMVLAQTEEGAFVLNWEYRHPTKTVLLSCPGGIKMASETALECAQRELLEETGFDAEQFELMGEAYPFPGVCNQKTVFVSAKNAKKKKEPQLEPAEFIETVVLSPESLKKVISENVPVDCLLLSALFFFENQ